MTFQPDINVGFVGISSGHDVKDTALGGNHGEYSVVSRHQAGQRFAGTIVRKKANRL